MSKKVTEKKPKDYNQKIKTLSELLKIIPKLKAKKKTIVHCHGVFDLLHPGHIRHFEAAKKRGDVLIVTITKDEFVNRGPGRPVFNERLRAESIAALEVVDFVAINEWPTAVNTIKLVKPHIYVKGHDYADKEKDITGKIYDEEVAIKSVGGRLYITDEITFSSTHLLNIHFDVYPKDAKEFLLEFKNKYSSNWIIDSFNKISDLKVLVIGEAIIDEYHYCQALGKATKDPIITTRYLYEEKFTGGALAAANHIGGFCKDVHLITCLGKTGSQKDFILEKLRPNIKYKFFYKENFTTIIKRRFVIPELLTKMFEINFLDDSRLSKGLEKEIYNYLNDIIKNYDLVIVADFGHGFITEKIRDLLCKRASFLAVNTQTNSANLGFNLITKYPKADYVCIDEPELRLATHDSVGDIKEAILKIAKVTSADRIAITSGHHGSITYDKKAGFFKTPIFSEEVVDRIGAGDAYLSVTSPCVCKGIPMDLVGFIGNAVGALAVKVVCNKSPVEPVQLYKFITALLK